ncbi:MULTISPECIES: ABC transporter permease [Tatumella]|uniref:ABC transporter permease n=1 Tax=Tatumella punctata TaxID=399969 RepID=A0ABW1VJU7_9GAMM|nr:MULTISPECIES: ABC transporter permease [unclassified Tatumella]MBS0855121.1 ABC transporter permease [Tatumella sp. JGM16]MBS0876151.1 ABC transporter permease [Tatumella sp. JGM82]MBS0889199.1 ABC transporter permease [Tatumella sp. JGM94]MBS0901081.1 ABC transporter permease [Tatumella sp. JGM100]MBS0912016.1 ABC transporter permease [Tatumella sp. JGM91]
MRYLSAAWHFFVALTPAGRLGLLVSLFWVVIAIAGQALAPYPVNDIGAGPLFGGMSAHYWLGTDYLGRDILSRIIAGSRYSIGLALTSAILASVIGTLLALLAAVSGSWLEEILGRINDALLVLPGKVMSLMIVAVFGSSLPMLIITAVFTYWPGAYRIAFALASQLRNMDYVRASALRGESRWYLAIHEILPNMIHPMLTDFGLRFVYIVLLLSGLSFLGLGVQPPQADWGSLVRENLQGLFDGSPAILMPALAIASLTIGVNLFIDSLQNMRPLVRVQEGV